MGNIAKVYLVGAGPGDPDLLTVKALRLLQTAQVVAYDRLVSPEILALIPAGVTRISVGKKAGRHGVPQNEINDLLVSLAAPGRMVVRLKGGDPFIFGRGSEEADHLRRHAIPFEVVPGITAGAACSAYAGIPLSHRGMSRRVQFVTGRFFDDTPVNLDWQGLADPDSTLVIYMGLGNLNFLCRRLLSAGLSPATPAAAIQDGTTPRQQRVLSTLGALADAVTAADLSAPVTVLIGQTISLALDLDWFQPETVEVHHAAHSRISG